MRNGLIVLIVGLCGPIPWPQKVAAQEFYYHEDFAAGVVDNTESGGF